MPPSTYASGARPRQDVTAEEIGVLAEYFELVKFEQVSGRTEVSAQGADGYW